MDDVPLRSRRSSKSAEDGGDTAPLSKLDPPHSPPLSKLERKERDVSAIAARLENLGLPDLRSLASMLAISGRSKLTGDKLVPAILHEIATPRTLMRNIDDLPEGVQFSDPETFYRLENALCSYNCHHGQRKLFFTMLEFLTLCAQRMRMSDTLVVYVGAAPGYNMRMISELFPAALYLLIDPAPFDVKDSQNLRIWNRFFTDESIEDIRKYQKVVGRKHLVFVSDIRLSPKEEEIGKDMQCQQRWGVKLQSAAMMLKFRLPYFGSPVTNAMVRDAEDKLDSIRHELQMPTQKSKSMQSYLYLDGIVLAQLYAPLRSAETRLVVFHPSMSSSSFPTSPRSMCTAEMAPRPPRGGGEPSRYRMRYWDYKKYEAKMNAFNIVCRSLLTYNSQSDEADSGKLGDHLLGYGSDYESVAEYQLASEYLKWERQCKPFRAAGVGGRKREGPRQSEGYAALEDPVTWHGGDTAGARGSAKESWILNKELASSRAPAQKPALEQVVRFLHRLNMRLVSHYSSKISLVLCAIKTMATHTRKYNELEEDARNAQIKMVSDVVLARFERQMKVVAQSSLLTMSEKQEMIVSVAREVNALSREESFSSVHLGKRAR